MARTDTRYSWLIGLLGALIVSFALGGMQAARADLYSINGIKVDETAQDAVQAKKKALGGGQSLAFQTLMHRLTRAEDRAALPEIKPGDISRLMDSMSVEGERTSGTRYIATLNIRFRPEQIRDFLLQFNVPYADLQAPGVLLLTIWQDASKPTIWDPPNPWREAWVALNVENSITPLFMPLGDLTDISTINATDVLSGNEEKLQKIKDRYAVENVLVAVAEKQPGGAVRATIRGATSVGPVEYDNVFPGDGSGNPNTALGQAARTVLTSIEDEWKANNLQSGRPNGSSMTVAVPFTSIGEWNNIRQRIASTIGIGSVSVRRLSSQGAVVDIVFSGDLGELNSQLAQSGFKLTDIGDTWVLQQR